MAYKQVRNELQQPAPDVPAADQADALAGQFAVELPRMVAVLTDFAGQHAPELVAGVA